eukprot:TRINITY_DN1434_c0_g2_i16.p1 TRINITY_DN1434_c0_g2~~TRINITY_DN1434_c0_g2_i16.p1  ORF type:complete len:177 (-),score=42.99 TRINITY_DN1434_c0_g2_i16:62-592(-)
MCIRDRIYYFFFFSSRRRHTRSCLVSWARRCVQETGVHGDRIVSHKIQILDRKNHEMNAYSCNPAFCPTKCCSFGDYCTYFYDQCWRYATCYGDSDCYSGCCNGGKCYSDSNSVCKSSSPALVIAIVVAVIIICLACTKCMKNRREAPAPGGLAVNVGQPIINSQHPVSGLSLIHI